MVFGGNTRDLGSFGEETDEITTLHQSQRKKCVQWLETASEILVTPSELASAVSDYLRRRQNNSLSLTTMGDENPIHTFGDFSRPSHEGYQNTIELPDGNNVVPLRSDTIRLGKDAPAFISISLRDQASNRLERLPAGSISGGSYYSFPCLIISIEKDCKTPNDILMFQQHQVNLSLKHGLVSKTYKKSLIMALIFGSKSKSFMTISIPLQGEPSINWPVNDPRDFAKPVKAISLLQNVLSTSDCRLIKLENQVHHLMEAHLAPKSLVQVNKIASLCEICNGPHDT
ncbi:hypothetical protein Tco_1001340 [Tanacetum coccineum]